MKMVENTESVCPLCFQEGKINKINAQLIEDEKKIWMLKKCPTHGSFRELYFNDEDVYNKLMTHKVTGPPVPEIKTSLFDDPPLYAVHLSQPVLTNLVVTNRSNQYCTDCSMNAVDAGYVYEPSIEQLTKLMRQSKGGTPPGSYAIQITGGEPTLREDLFEILGNAKKIGFSHIQVQTNGLKLAENIEYCKRLKNSGIDTVYMRFDGVTHETNPLISFHIKALENLRNVNMNVVLVPILIGGKNVYESGKIVRFALDNINVVRGVHFLPLTFSRQVAKIDSDERSRQRVDFIQMIAGIEQEFTGMISRDDFYPISLIDPLSQLVEMITREPQVRFTAHPCCGESTFLYLKEGKPLPITRFLNAETIIQFINDQKKKKGPLRKFRIAGALVKNIDSFIENEKAPYGFDLRRMVKDIVIGGDRYAMREFHHKTLLVGSMWYQDVWNLDIDRLKRCVVHYTTPEGIIPYCSYDGLGYGEKIQKRYSISIEEWEKKTGRQLEDDFQKNGA
jgi:uncharacterized radical SAM superfamily Fe-S cluster-containing enzyme